MNMPKKPKWLLITLPFFLISSTMIYKSIIQIEWQNDIRFAYYIIGAIILSIGLSILDNKVNEK